MTELVVLGALLVAFVNGANDNFKGVATLYGSGALGYRRALGMATVATAAGGLASLLLAGALVRSFSAKGIVPEAALTPEYLAAVSLGAGATVLLATRWGLPISTTHALVGGLVGAGVVAAGDALRVQALGAAFLVPLAVGPVVATALGWSSLHGSRRLASRLGVRREDCVCIGEEWVPVATAGASALAALRLSVGTGSEPECRTRYAGRVLGVSAETAVTRVHVLSGALVSFARGLNDTPKILGLVVGATALAPVPAVLAITLAMALGGLLAARRVAETLSHRITPISPARGCVANLGTAFLVTCASRLGLPVSTTHVSTGSIFGIGADSGALQRRKAAEILGAWVFTLPLAAVLAALLMAGFA